MASNETPVAPADDVNVCFDYVRSGLRFKVSSRLDNLKGYTQFLLSPTNILLCANMDLDDMVLYSFCVTWTTCL